MMAHLIWIFFNLPRDASALRSAISTLESDIASLDKSSASPEYWLAGFTALVAIGVAIEIVVLRLDHDKEMEEWLLCELIPRKPSLRKLGWEIASIILVTVGVIGELGTGLWISHIDSEYRAKSGELQGDSDQLLALVTQQAGDAAKSAKKAGEEADAARTSADEAQQKAEAVGKQAKALEAQLGDEKKQLDNVDAKRAELEKSLINLAACNAPRVLRDWSSGNVVGQRKSIIDPLKSSFGVQTIIEFIPNDPEAKRAALSLAGTLGYAGWFVRELTPVEGIDDGVEVQSFLAPLGADDPTEQAESRSLHAAGLLVDFLHSYNWQANHGYPVDEYGKLIRGPKIIPPGGVRIRIGLYPAVIFVTPPGAKDFAEAIAEEDQKIKEMRKQMQEEILKRMTPEQAAKRRALLEEVRKREESFRKQYSGPCQTLSPFPPR